MYVCVCVSECMRVNVHVRICVCVFVCAPMCACLCMCMCVRVRVCGECAHFKFPALAFKPLFSPAIHPWPTNTTNQPCLPQTECRVTNVVSGTNSADHHHRSMRPGLLQQQQQQLLQQQQQQLGPLAAATHLFPTLVPGQILGQGNFGSVWEAHWHDTRVALKVCLCVCVYVSVCVCVCVEGGSQVGRHMKETVGG